MTCLPVKIWYWAAAERAILLKINYFTRYSAGYHILQWAALRCRLWFELWVLLHCPSSPQCWASADPCPGVSLLSPGGAYAQGWGCPELCCSLAGVVGQVLPAGSSPAAPAERSGSHTPRRSQPPWRPGHHCTMTMKFYCTILFCKE